MDNETLQGEIAKRDARIAELEAQLQYAQTMVNDITSSASSFLKDSTEARYWARWYKNRCIELEKETIDLRERLDIHVTLASRR